jgi:hypothetical protein
VNTEGSEDLHRLEPFGDIRAEIGDYAGEFRQQLESKPESTGTEALSWLCQIESLLPIVEVPDEIDGDVRKRASDAIFSLHTALPFEEAERDWLVKVHHQLARHHKQVTPELFASLQGQIMLRGVQRAVEGQDLMRRWQAWLRQGDEFEGQGSLDQARDALGTLHQLMT